MRVTPAGLRGRSVRCAVAPGADPRFVPAQVDAPGLGRAASLPASGGRRAHVPAFGAEPLGSHDDRLLWAAGLRRVRSRARRRFAWRRPSSSAPAAASSRCSRSGSTSASPTRCSTPSARASGSSCRPRRWHDRRRDADRALGRGRARESTRSAISAGTWTDLGSAAGSVTVGVNRIQVPAGKWSTPGARRARGGGDLLRARRARASRWQDGETVRGRRGRLPRPSDRGEDAYPSRGAGRARRARVRDAHGARRHVPSSGRASFAWAPERPSPGRDKHPWELEAEAGEPEVPASRASDRARSSPRRRFGSPSSTERAATSSVP